MKKSTYLLQGVFFFEDIGFCIGHDPEIGERVVIGKCQAYALFNAVISSFADGRPGLGGVMMDRFGTSRLRNIILSKVKISFTKQYENRPPIFYNFESKDAKGGWWKGTYQGKDCGEGLAHCFIKIVDSAFFLAKNIKCS